MSAPPTTVRLAVVDNEPLEYWHGHHELWEDGINGAIKELCKLMIDLL